MQLSAVGESSASTARSRAWPALLAISSLAGVIGVLKGLAPTVVDGSQFYWMFSYENGFVRRALIGTLVRPVLRRFSFEQLAPWIAVSHVVVCLSIIVFCVALFRRAVNSEVSTETRVTLTFAFLVLMCSQWLPTLAHDVGYVDIYVMSLVLTGLWLVLRERYVAAALVATIGPLIHEEFIFLWAPVTVVLAWSCLTVKTNVREKLLAAALPIVSTAAVTFFQSDAAAAREITALPLSSGLKDGLRAYQLEQTLQSSFHEMMARQFPGNLDRVEVAAVYFLLPSAAILWAAAFCYWRRWHAPWTTLLVLVVATLSPLAILALAWDLSRFLVWANLGAAIALIASGTPKLVR